MVHHRDGSPEGLAAPGNNVALGSNAETDGGAEGEMETSEEAFAAASVEEASGPVASEGVAFELVAFEEVASEVAGWL